MVVLDGADSLFDLVTQSEHFAELLGKGRHLVVIMAEWDNSSVRQMRQLAGDNRVMPYFNALRGEGVTPVYVARDSPFIQHDVPDPEYEREFRLYFGPGVIHTLPAFVDFSGNFIVHLVYGFHPVSPLLDMFSEWYGVSLP
jgi:hypothetical protein